MSISPLRRIIYNTRWMKWHKAGRRESFRSPLMKEVELDITTKCSSSFSCAKTCPVRGLDSTLDVEVGLRIIEQTYDLGFTEIVFSGGEPLERESQETFFTLLRAARARGFETTLLTNGMFLSPDIASRLLPYLDLLRVSISDSSHLQAVRDNIRESVDYRDRFYPRAVICASHLITPDFPREELAEDVGSLVRSGVDFIRFKRKHIKRCKEGSFASNIKAYKDIAEFISELNQKFPKANILKIKGFPNSEIIRYPFCYFSDFFPFSIGVDGRAYSCCELTYREEFVRGDFREQSAEHILESFHHSPQEVKEEDCFCGCRGDSENVGLHRLLLTDASP